MDFVPSGTFLALYALTLVCAVATVAVWALTKQGRRNAGFATKSQLKRHLSAKAVLKAREIRPSLTQGEERAARAWAVNLSKKRSSSS
ncbi:hypothetical protein ACWC9Q_10555 [Streptomyces sp. NPDC001142]